MKQSDHGHPFLIMYLLIGVLALVYISSSGTKEQVNELKGTVEDLQKQVDDLSNGNSPTAIKRRQFQAELKFILCSRNGSILDDDKLADVSATCAGYDSLASSYETQGVPAPAP